MKQYNKLFAILFAVLGVSTIAKAQTDVTSTYLTNAGFENGNTNGWTVNIPSGYKNTDVKKQSDDGYNFGSSAPSEGTYYLATRSGWNNSNGGNVIEVSQTTATSLPAGKYFISCDYKAIEWCSQTWFTSPISMIVKDSKATIIVQSDPYHLAKWVKDSDGGFANYLTEAEWTSLGVYFELSEAQNVTFTTQASLWSNMRTDLNVDNYRLYDVSNADANNLIDFTGLIANSKMEMGSSNRWDALGEHTNTSYSGFSGKYMLEKWTGSTLGDFNSSQTISFVPNGKYRFSAYVNATVQSQEDEAAKNSAQGVYLYAGESEKSIATLDGVPEKFSVDAIVTDNKLTLGLKTVSTTTNWIAWDNLTLEYLGPDLSSMQNTFKENYDRLKALSTEEVPTAYATMLTEKITNYQTVPEILSELEIGNADMVAIIEAHPTIISTYTQLNSLIALCESYSTNSEPKGDARTAFNEAINAAKSSANNATTTSTLTDIYSTLESARQTYVLNAFPINNVTFDLTFKTNTTWANSGNNYTAGGVVLKEKYAEQPWVGDVMSTSYTDLPNGTYDVEIYCNANACEWNFTSDITDGAENSSVTANEVIVKVPVYKLKSNSTANAITLTDVVVKDHTMNIAIKNDVLGANWILANHKSLTLKAGLDVSEQQANVTELLAEANVLTSQPMSSEIKAQLTTAINDADATSDNPDELEAMITALQTAIPAANASIADYELIKTYINKAKVFSTEIVATYETGYNNGSFTEAETVRQELNVATANYVAENFKYEIALTDWGAASGNAMWSTQGEHWDGTGSTQYYDANSTDYTHTLAKTVELTPGTYIFRGAGRAHPNTTLSLSVSIDGIEPAVFNAKDNSGRGIDKEGNATFADDAQYAKDGQGQGWEWEFIKFTLNETTTVTLTATCQTSGWGWASFANNGLWMDEATYVKAQAITLNKVKTQAQALVDTKPMGSAENNALKAAIAQAESTIDTAEEMNNALNALNTAVENASKWVDSYYNAKGLLVAALERFESEFNDGENGALRFIPTDIWGNIIDRVMDAAQAKDLLDDYSNFSQTATDLHAAMNAVFESYIKYGMLEEKTSLIGNADCTDNAAWSGTGRTTYDDQHWSGSTRVYFTQNHENGAARTQTITLPKAGTYLLKASVRAVEAASYAEFIINGVSYRTTGAHGRVGGTIATDGSEWESVEAGIAAGKSFANGNKGYGWVYTYIYFDGKAGENTIAINLSNCNSSREANCGGMELYYLRPNYAIEEGNIVKHYGIYDEAIVATHTSHDVTNATLANKVITVSTSPNTLIISNEGQVSNASNVIVDGTAAKLSLTDGYAFHATADFTAGTLSYNREFTKDTWLTVCLPFAYTIPEDVKVETLSEIDTDTKTFTFDEVTGTMEANKPYIVKNSTEAAALFASLGNTTVVATPEAMSITVNGSEGEFIGTYTTLSSTELMENGTYDILFFGTDGQLYYLSQGVTTKVINFKPFRAYIRLPKGDINWADGQQARVRHRAFGEATDIENPESTIQDSQFIYDLMGRKVSTMEKGKMYIVNGKKVIR